MNEVYARHVGDDAAGALDRRGREAPVRRARRDRGDRARLTAPSTMAREGDRGLRPLARARRVPRRRRGARRAARARVEGRRLPRAGRRHRRAARARSQPHGRVEELVVAGRPVGLRLYPRDRDVRALAPAGIEFAPPRRERSTGPGRHDFEIVVDPHATRRGRSRAPRLHGQRDGAPPRRRRRSSTRSAGAPTSSAACSARSRRGASPRIRCGSCAACGSSRSSASTPTSETLAQMREEARRVALVSGERIGGGLAADGMGELSKLLLGARARARRCGSRATRACSSRCCPSSGRRSGSTRRAADHDLTRRRAHLRGRPGRRRRGHAAARAARGALPRPRQAAVAWRGTTAADYYAKPATPRATSSQRRLADGARRLRYPNELRERVVRIVRFHMFDLGAGDALEARRLLARYGDGLRSTCSTTGTPTCAARDRASACATKLERARALPRASSTQELGEPAPARRPRRRRRPT